MHIESPDLEALGAKLERIDPVDDLYRPAAREVGSRDIENDVFRALRAAGASEGLLDDLGTYESPDGEVYVGVPATSTHVEEMREIEYGTVNHAPDAPIRRTVLGRERELSDRFTDALTRNLDAELR